MCSFGSYSTPVCPLFYIFKREIKGKFQFISNGRLLCLSLRTFFLRVLFCMFVEVVGLVDNMFGKKTLLGGLVLIFLWIFFSFYVLLYMQIIRWYFFLKRLEILLIFKIRLDVNKYDTKRKKDLENITPRIHKLIGYYSREEVYKGCLLCNILF